MYVNFIKHEYPSNNNIEPQPIIDDLRKKGEKKALQLIKAYQEALRRGQETNAMALGKIRELSAEIQELKKITTKPL